jgi:signal transduction histidine kinase/CheY-like chemotaxis protein
MPPTTDSAKDRPGRPATFLAAYLVAYAAAVLLVRGRTPPVALGFDTAYMAFRATAAYVLWQASRRSLDPTIARGWRYLAIGQCFALLGNGTWIWSDLSGSDVANWAYLAVTVPQDVCNIAGYWVMLRPPGGRVARPGDWVDAAILVVACASLAWYFIAARLVTTAYDDATGVVLFFFDNAANGATLLLSAAVWLRSPPGLDRRAMPRTVAGLVLLALADLIIEKQLTSNTYVSGSWIDIVYGASILLVTLGADAQCRNPAGARDRPGAANRADALVLGALLLSLVPLGNEIVSTPAFARDPLAASAVGVVVLMLLVLWRQRLARQEIDQLVASRLRLEQDLWQAQKLESIGRLAAGIAHDFNNILASIGSHTQVLRAHDTAAVRSAAAEVEFATGRAAVLVKRLLTFGRTDAPGTTEVALGGTVAAMRPMLRDSVGRHHQLEFDLADDGAGVRLAEGQLEQIVLNLAVNARDATPPGGAISVSTRRVLVESRSALHRRGVEPGWWATLEVRDTGAGMDAATRQRLFEPFFTTKGERGGTGMGLATVASIVHGAGGHVIVDSAEGAGTSMTVVLPLGAPPQATGAPAEPDPVALPSVPTLLVVDDELPIRSALRRFLTRAGYRVLEAADAAQAMSQVEQHAGPLDLVLTDVQLPGTSGAELARQIRARRPDARILFMSGHHDLSRTGGEIAAEDLVEKPFDLDALAERIRTRVAGGR